MVAGADFDLYMGIDGIIVTISVDGFATITLIYTDSKILQ
jgi:hypothetical protein